MADQKQPLEERQLSSFLQARWPSMLCPALRDAAHAHGVLHRLDAPSSGLALAANTFDAFYDLTMPRPRRTTRPSAASTQGA